MTTFNRTHIHINASQLTVRQKPFFAFGDHTLDREQIKQVYVEYSVHGFHGRNAKPEYCVRAVLQNHPTVILIGHIKYGADALYIEQEITRYLGIPAAAI